MKDVARQSGPVLFVAAQSKKNGKMFKKANGIKGTSSSDSGRPAPVKDGIGAPLVVRPTRQSGPTTDVPCWSHHGCCVAMS